MKYILTILAVTSLSTGCLKTFGLKGEVKGFGTDKKIDLEAKAETE